MGKKDPVNFTNEELLQRLSVMEQLIYDNTLIALEAEAALEAGNDLLEPLGLKDAPFYGALCFTTIQNSLALNLSLSLARLFEEASDKKHSDYSDIASIPLLVQILKKPECRALLSDNAKKWTPHIEGMEEAHARGCLKAVDDILNKYEELKNSPEGIKALERLEHLRTTRLAHSLHGKAPKALPIYKEVFFLMDSAHFIGVKMKLALKGENHDLSRVESENYRIAKAFWEPALKGVKNPQ